MTQLTTIYIGVGSNLCEPIQQAQRAIDTLRQHTQLFDVKASALYHSKPVGPQDQPDYINAVVEAKTHLAAHHVLDLLQHIEHKQGRVRQRHWGERTLDLDLLLYGVAEIHTPRLTVPHAYLTERSFVLYPLAELAPDLLIPGAEPLKRYLERVKNDLDTVKNAN